MPSKEITSDLVPALIEKGLPIEKAKRVKDLVIGRADALKRRGENEVQIDVLAKLIDDVLGLRKDTLRCFVILRARDAIESLIDPKQKTA